MTQSLLDCLAPLVHPPDGDDAASDRDIADALWMARYLPAVASGPAQPAEPPEPHPTAPASAPVPAGDTGSAGTGEEVHSRHRRPAGRDLALHSMPRPGVPSPGGRSATLVRAPAVSALAEPLV